MFPYWIVTAFVVGAVWLSDKVLSRSPHRVATTDKPRLFGVFDLLGVGVLVWFAGWRYMVGTDFPAYLAHFVLKIAPEDVPGTLRVTDHEIGFTMLELLCRSAFESEFAIFWVSAALAVVPTYLVALRTSRAPAFSILLFILLGYYTSGFNTMRQGIAVGIVFCATQVSKGSIGWAIGLVALAGTFHTSAWLAGALLLLLLRASLGLKHLVVGLMASAVLGGALIQTGWATALASLLNERYEGYIGAEAGGLGTLLNIAFRVVLIVVLAWAGAFKSDRYRTPLVVGLFGTAFMLLGLSTVAITRLDQYFSIVLIVAIPNALAEVRAAWWKWGVVAAASVAYFVATLHSFGDLIPYQLQP